jgi:DNA invertase Pin-like site-specific DNA recombinase
MKKILRLAAYVRVSHDEQVKHGYSLEAQKEAIVKWAEENGYIIVEWYIDEGVSGRKKVKNRPQMQRMLNDVQAGEIDLIVFIKLDRYFRSVSEYHATQRILETNNTHWKAILEDYDTTTVDGRFKINIMLSIAEQEADRTSDRIKFTFDHKVKKKQPIFGTQPFGYTIGDNPDGTKKVIKDENKAYIVEAIFEHFLTYHSISAATYYVNSVLEYEMKYNTIQKMLKNTYYKGEYKGVTDYCPAYITPETYDEVQRIRKGNIRTPSTRRVYLFTGLIRCHKCNSIMTSCYNVKGGKTYHYYRCNNAHKHRHCANRHSASEMRLEKYLLEKIKPELEKYIAEVELSGGVNIKPKIDRAEIVEEMERITYVFRKNRMKVEDYEKEYTELEKKLELLNQEEPKTDISKLKEFLQSDILDIYSTLSREDKRAAWHSILKEIHIDENKNYTPIFL